MLNSMPQSPTGRSSSVTVPWLHPYSGSSNHALSSGLRVVGQVHVDDSGNTHLTGKESASSAPFERMHRQDESPRAVDLLRVNRVIVTMGDRRGKLPVEALLQLKSNGIWIQDGAEVYEAVTGKIPIQSLRLSWLLFSQGFRITRPMMMR